MEADLVIRGGRVADGTGSPPFPGDVAVSHGRIAEIGPALKGKSTLDASGCIVAPGFIDIHTHYDAQVFWDPALTPSCYHGVTTVVAGNCGFSIAPTRPDHRDVIIQTLENVEDMDPRALQEGVSWEFTTFPEYLAAIERRGVGLNFAAYLGHTALRLFEMDMAAYERTAQPDEVARMCETLREALDAGAAGFATSFGRTHRGINGLPVPSRFAAKDELLALVDVVRKAGRGVVAIVPGDQCTIAELYEVQGSSGVPMTYGALLTSPEGRQKELVDLNRSGWARGAHVWPQVSPRPLTFSYSLAAPYPLDVNPCFGELIGSGPEDRRRAYADRGWRQRVLSAWESGPAFGIRWDTYEIAESAAHPEVVGARLADCRAGSGVSPFDALLDLALDEPDLALRVRCVLANDDTPEVAKLLREENCTLGLSDAGAHSSQLCDAPQATDLLGPWVRDRDLMPVETAVRKLSGQQADIFSLEDRGYITVGSWADVVVFDPDTVAPGPVRRVRDFPGNSERLTADDPQGIRHVLVNGEPIHLDGQHISEARPGRIVKPGSHKVPAPS